MNPPTPPFPLLPIILECFRENPALPPPVYLYQLYVTEGKIIKTKLITQSKTENFINNVNIEAQLYKHTQMEH